MREVEVECNDDDDIEEEEYFVNGDDNDDKDYVPEVDGEFDVSKAHESEKKSR